MIDLKTVDMISTQISGNVSLFALRQNWQFSTINSGQNFTGLFQISACKKMDCTLMVRCDGTC